VDGAAADRDHVEFVAEFTGDLFPVFGEYGERAGPDVAQPDYAYIDFLHILSMITAGIGEAALKQTAPKPAMWS
jgi:hypothetical protein